MIKISASGWYDRDEIGRVTKGWVHENVRLTDREVNLLKIIRDRKIVRRDMLEVISSDYRYLGSNRTRIINRSLGKMFKNMCIDKIHEPKEFMKGNKPAMVSLDRAGSIILGVNHRQRIRHIANVVDGVKYIRRELPSGYKHINGVNMLEVKTINFCENSSIDIYNWKVENRIDFYYNRNKVSVIPDISMSLSGFKKFENKFHAYIEYDTGSESLRYLEPPIIRDKILKYKMYKLSNLWSDKYPYFPFLLLVTKDKSRISFFNDTCKKNGIVGVGVYYKNYDKFLSKISNMLTHVKS